MTDNSHEKESSIHIIFIVNVYPPHLGGLERHVFQLAKSLRRLGVKVTVLTLSRKSSRKLEDGITVFRLSSSREFANIMSLPKLGTGRKIRRIVMEERGTVISVHTRFFPMSFIGVRVAKSIGLPVVMTEHGSGHVSDFSLPVRLVSKFIDHTLGKWTLKHSTKILGVSKEASRFVKHLSGIQADIFPNAIDTKIFTPSITKPEYPLPKLIFLGRLIPGKGWRLVFDIFERLAHKISDITLHIVGNGPDRNKIKSSITSSAFRERIFFHGAISPEETSKILEFGILLNPCSRKEEGFQITLLEAACALTKIITSPVPSAHYLAELGFKLSILENYEIDCWSDATLKALESRAPTLSAQTQAFDWSIRTKQYHAILLDTIKASSDL